MKLLIKALSAGMVLTIIFSVIPFSASCTQLWEDVFRLHILANSDSAEDQALKLKIRDNILAFSSEKFDSAKNKSDVITITQNNLDAIINTAKKTIAEEGYDYDVRAEITEMYFDTRVYDNITMPAGKYKALRLLIGSGSGKNWWCVMFPPICIGASTDSTTLEDTLDSDEIDVVENGQKYEYKFKIVEYYEKIVSWFS